MLFIVQIAIGLVILGILVLIHELGHFLMAKAWGIRVIAFSIGFGKPIVKKTINGTEYRIGSIPFGGYVSMPGEHPEDDAPPKPGDFNSKSIGQRALVALAGPAANFLFAMILLWIMFLSGVEKPIYLDRTVIGAVADSSAAKQAGLCPGDSIISINGKKTENWESIQGALSSRSSEVNVVFVRDGRTATSHFAMPTIQGRGIPRQPFAGLYSPLPAIIGSVNTGSPAEKAGLKALDTVVSINGQSIHSWFQLSESITHFNPSAGPMSFVVRRIDSPAPTAIAIIPEYKKDLHRYLIGAAVMSPPVKKVRYSASEAVSQTVSKSWEYTIMIFDVVAKLVSKQVSMQQLAGPVGIVQMSGVVAMGGLAAILDFMALIGINLAVINLLPLVITDGGLLLFLFIEFLRRKPLAVKYQAIVNRIAIAFFITLFIYVTFNDVARIPELFRLMK
jgi:regulator of sigma E protease